MATPLLKVDDGPLLKFLPDDASQTARSRSVNRPLGHARRYRWRWIARRRVGMSAKWKASKAK